MIIKSKAITNAIIAGNIILYAQSTHAEKTGLSEVIVTAQKYEQNIQTVPIAITAITAEELQNKGITGFSGVAESTPSITTTAYPSSATTLTLCLRAMCNGNPEDVNGEGAVGIYEDGFYIARVQASTFDLMDMERIEVLRGPQGALYGRNTTGGAVNLISKKPTGVFGLKQTLDFGTRDKFRSLTTIDLPAYSGVSSKISLLKSSEDGYVKNSGGSDYGEEQQTAGRLALRWSAADTVLVDYFYENGSLDSTPIYYQNASLEGQIIEGFPYTKAGDPRRRTFRPLDLKESTSSYYSHGLTISWDVLENLTIKSLTGYRDLNSRFNQNYADSFTAAPGESLNLITENIIKQHQFSQEIQLIGSFFDEQISYVAGLYYFEESGSGFKQLVYPSFSVDRRTTLKADAESKAVYSQITWTPEIFQRDIDFVLGLRYTKDDRSAERYQAINGFVIENGPATGTEADMDFDKFNPSFTVNYRWEEDISLYAKVVTGYRAGGIFSSAPPGRFDQADFDPEELTSYEIGFKSTFLDQRLRFNVAAFEARYDDMQVIYPTDAFDVTVARVLNVGEATIDGVEMDISLLVGENTVINVDYSWLDSTFDQVDVVPGSIYDGAVNPGSPYRVGDNLKDIFTLPYAPKNSYSISVDQTLWSGTGFDFSLFLDYRWRDDVKSSAVKLGNEELSITDSYGILDARLNLDVDLPKGDSATISLWGKNVLNEKYEQQIITFVQGVIPNASNYSNAIAWSEPPSYGISLIYEY